MVDVNLFCIYVRKTHRMFAACEVSREGNLSAIVFTNHCVRMASYGVEMNIFACGLA